MAWGLFLLYFCAWMTVKAVGGLRFDSSFIVTLGFLCLLGFLVSKSFRWIRRSWREIAS